MAAENASKFSEKLLFSQDASEKEHISSKILKSENWKVKKFMNFKKIYSSLAC